MKIVFKIILIAFLAFWSEQVFPWWSAVVCAAMVSALIPTRGFRAFLSGSVAIGMLWLGCSLLYSFQTDFILTERVASLFGVNSSFVMILITTLVGALAGGMGALSGNMLRQNLRYKSPYRSRHEQV